MSLEEGDKTRRFCARSLIGRNPSSLFCFPAIRVVDPTVCCPLYRRKPRRGGEKGEDGEGKGGRAK